MAELIHDIVDATPAVTRSIPGKQNLSLTDLTSPPIATEDCRIWGVYLDVPRNHSEPVGLYVGCSTSVADHDGLGGRNRTHKAKGRQPVQQLRATEKSCE